MTEAAGTAQNKMYKSRYGSRRSLMAYDFAYRLFPLAGRLLHLGYQSTYRQREMNNDLCF